MFTWAQAQPYPVMQLAIPLVPTLCNLELFTSVITIVNVITYGDHNRYDPKVQTKLSIKDTSFNQSFKHYNKIDKKAFKIGNYTLITAFVCRVFISSSSMICNGCIRT